MSPLAFYLEQAAQQRVLAEDATLANVRERCQRAADAWAKLADQSERVNAIRTAVAPKPE